MLPTDKQDVELALQPYDSYVILLKSWLATNAPTKISLYEQQLYPLFHLNLILSCPVHDNLQKLVLGLYSIFSLVIECYKHIAHN